MNARQEHVRDNTSLMLSWFEMWIWKAEEDLRQLIFLEEIWKKFHRICSQASNVLVFTSLAVLRSERLDLVLDEICDLYSDLHS